MPTLGAIRRALVSEPPFVAVVGTTGALSGGSYVGTPSGADATRRIVSSDLADTAMAGGAYSDTESDFYQAGYIWLPASSTQRRVANNSYVASVAANTVLDAGGSVLVGHVTVHQAYSAAVAPNLAFEYHPHFPVTNTDRMPGLHTLINRALRSMRITTRLSFTGNGGNRYSLASYAWITKQSQLGPAWDAETVADTEPVPLDGGARMRFDKETAYLITGNRQTSGSTFTVDFYRPASSYIKVSGTWGTSTVGLVNESDEALPDLDDIVVVTRYFAFDALSKLVTSATERQRWDLMRNAERGIAAAYMQADQPEHIMPRGGWVQPRAQGALTRTSARSSWP